MKYPVLFGLLVVFLFFKFSEHFFAVPIFLRSYFDDFLFFPILLGMALWVQRKLVDPHFTFQIKQIAGAFMLLSVFFEFVFPMYINGYTSDKWDFLAYLLGVLFFFFFQNYSSKKSKV